MKNSFKVSSLSSLGYIEPYPTYLHLGWVPLKAENELPQEWKSFLQSKVLIRSDCLQNKKEKLSLLLFVSADEKKPLNVAFLGREALRESLLMSLLYYQSNNGGKNSATRSS